MNAELTSTDGLRLIAKERIRQIEEEGWIAAHDDLYNPDGELLAAAVCYATPMKVFKKEKLHGGLQFVDPWPWSMDLDKRMVYGVNRRDYAGVIPDPETYTQLEKIDLLAKAGALIAAEIDREMRTLLDGPASNQVKRFMAHHLIEVLGGRDEDNVWEIYCEWCAKENTPIVGRNQFTIQFKALIARIENEER